MELTIKGGPEEIAALGLAIQGRQGLPTNLCLGSPGGTGYIRFMNDVPECRPMKENKPYPHTY